MSTPRPTLTRDRIVRAAVGLIEREGAEKVTMRRVAAELGVAVMSLYNHVANKGDLLDGVAEMVMGRMEVPHETGAPWQDQARAMIRAFRKIAHDHPRSVSLAFTRKLDLPAGMRPAEHALALAEEAGFDAQTAVRIMRSLLSYAIGSEVRSSSQQKMLASEPGDPAVRLRSLDAGKFPRVIAHAAELTANDADSDFEFGLDLLINAIDALPRDADSSGRTRSS